MGVQLNKEYPLAQFPMRIFGGFQTGTNPSELPLKNSASWSVQPMPGTAITCPPLQIIGTLARQYGAMLASCMQSRSDRFGRPRNFTFSPEVIDRSQTIESGANPVSLVSQVKRPQGRSIESPTRTSSGSKSAATAEMSWTLFRQ